MAEPSLIALLFGAQRLRPRRKSRVERRHITEVRLQVFERSGGYCELQ